MARIALLLMGTTFAVAQTTSPPAPASGEETSQQQVPDQTQSGVQTADSEQQNSVPGSVPRAQVPPLLNMDAGSLAFTGEQGRSSYLRGGIGGGINYDDNLLSIETPRVGGFSYSALSNLGLDITRPRLAFKLGYEGGYTFNQRYSAYNQSTQSANVDLQYRLSPHVNLRLDNNFSYTTGFLNQLQSGVSGLGGGIVQQPNIAVITPFASHTDDFATVGLTYQYSANDMVGVNGTVNISSYGAPPTGAANLLDNRTEQASAFYTHGFTARNWSGIAYTFQRLTFDPVVENVDTHSLFLFHSIYLQRHTVLSFFAGPEYTQLNSEVVSTSITPPFVTVVVSSSSQNRWSAAGGASFDWQGRHTSFRASGTRKVSDGGGLLTAVDITTGNGAIRRQMSRTSVLQLGVLYASSHALDHGVTTFYSDLKSVSGSLVWEQHLSRNFTATFGYARDYQQENAPTAPTQNINHNRGWVSIGYQFTRPLGR